MFARFGSSSTSRAAACLPALALLLTLTAAAPAVAVGLYFESVPLPGGGAVMDLNNSGQAVGVELSALGTAFFYDGTATTMIGPPGWINSIAVSISDSGAIAGFGSDGGVTKGFVRAGGVTTVLLPPGWTAAQAMAVNDAGTVVGYGTLGVNERAFGYASSIYVPLPLPPGFTTSRALDISNDARVVGSVDGASGKKAFLFDGSFSFPAPPGWSETEARRINERGDILGFGSDGTRIKCYLLRDGVYTAIFDPQSFLTYCNDMNDRGEITGIGLNIAGSARVFVYRDGEYHYLDERVNTLFGSAAINNGRQLGGATPSGGTNRAVIASILPEALAQVKGSDGPVAAPRGTSPPVTVSLLGWTLAGRRADWWLFAQTPAGIFSFDAAARQWQPGLFPSAGIPLRDLRPLAVPGAGAAAGPYTYYFGVDLKPDGLMSPRYFFYARATVFLQ